MLCKETLCTSKTAISKLDENDLENPTEERTVF